MRSLVEVCPPGPTGTHVTKYRSRGGQNTHCTYLGFYGSLHIERDRSANATQTITFLSSHSEVRKKTSPGSCVNLRNMINLPSVKISSTRDRLLLEYVKKGLMGDRKRRAKHCDFVSLFGWQSLKCCARLSCPGSGRVIRVSALPLSKDSTVTYMNASIALVRTPNTVSQPFARILGIYRHH